MVAANVTRTWCPTVRFSFCLHKCSLLSPHTFISWKLVRANSFCICFIINITTHVWLTASIQKVRVVTRYMRSGITAPGSGITTLGIGISSVLVESGIKIVNVFGIRDQNSQCFCDQGLKFSTFLWSGIKIWGKNTGSVMKKYTLLRPWESGYTSKSTWDEVKNSSLIYIRTKMSALNLLSVWIPSPSTIWLKNEIFPSRGSNVVSH